MSDRPKIGLSEVLAQVVACDHDGYEPDLSGGRRVEYVVIAVRGVFAHAQAVDGSDDKHRENAEILARKFKVDVEALPGHRFSYRVVPAEHGKFMVDFELVGGPVTR
ncbi:hypothetical protein [Catenulispora subtropica]|uniref:Uncharacterized protein n=1 Tax=Catenulispora subtropica TaxID=450798 RepID=A0ABN2T8K4_9ACTN